MVDDYLGKHVIYAAMHNSRAVRGKGLCHPSTRTKAQEIVMRWADGNPQMPVMWLSGAAGAGKSAIMRTMAERLEKEKRLLATFFCDSKERSDITPIIPTLVQQIAIRTPAAAAGILAAFKADVGLLSKCMDIQAKHLIVASLDAIYDADHPSPNIIILDGLDEIAEVREQQELLKTIASILDQIKFPIRFLVASRPEIQIQNVFKTGMNALWTPLPLDMSLKPNEDIDKFYVAKFRHIRDVHPQFNLALDWPGPEVRRHLVGKGSGQWIFPAVVVDVVGDPDETNTLTPQERLDLFLGLTMRHDLRLLDQIDLLYASVFDRIPPTEREDVLMLISLIITPDSTFDTFDRLDYLFCSPSGTTRQKLRRLHSVLLFPEDDFDPIQPLHATLGEFISNKNRSERFHCHLDQRAYRSNSVILIAKCLLTSGADRDGG